MSGTEERGRTPECRRPDYRAYPSCFSLVFHGNGEIRIGLCDVERQAFKPCDTHGHACCYIGNARSLPAFAMREDMTGSVIPSEACDGGHAHLFTAIIDFS